MSIWAQKMSPWTDEMCDLDMVMVKAIFPMEKIGGLITGALDVEASGRYD